MRKAEKIPRISLICVVLNVAKYIEETIQSVLAQTYGGWELLVIDGVSDDGTQEIVAKYAKSDPRIKLYSEPDEGPWDATEKGLAKAQGEFIMIVSGNDGFLDNEWFEKCLKVFDADQSISLVWASTRGMCDDGTLLPEEHVTYSHFIKKEGRADVAQHVARKLFKVLKDVALGSSGRKKILLKKIFSKTAVLKLNFFTRRSFRDGKPPQKEDWFKYWLDTGTTFSEQPMCVSKSVFLDCVAKYPRGSRIVMNHIMDFHYNFNAKGYLACYIPTLAAFGRMHPDNSGARIPGELQSAAEKYLQKILALRKRILGNHEEMVFVDRDAKEVSRKKF